MTTILADFPAYTVLAYEGEELPEGGAFMIAFPSKRYGMQYRKFILGSVAGYAAKNGDNVGVAVMRAREQGHDLFYAFSIGAMLTAEPHAKETHVGIAFDDVIKFAGKLFYVRRAPNDNAHLVEVK